MALTLGVNCGFVTSAPTTDPSAGNLFAIDNAILVMKHKSPAGNYKIVEMGWYMDNVPTEEANFEVGLYDSDGIVAPGEAGTLLFSNRTNAKGTAVGWKVVKDLNWPISGSKNYWLGVQLDDTATQTTMAYTGFGGSGVDFNNTQTTLINPFGGGAIFDADGKLGIYALIEPVQLGTAGTKYINSNWPHEEGLTLGTTKLRSNPKLDAGESLVSEKDTIGL